MEEPMLITTVFRDNFRNTPYLQSIKQILFATLAPKGHNLPLNYKSHLVISTFLSLSIIYALLPILFMQKKNTSLIHYTKNKVHRGAFQQYLMIDMTYHSMNKR